MAKYKVKFMVKAYCEKEIDIKNEADPYIEADAIGDTLNIRDFWIDEGDIQIEDLKPNKINMTIEEIIKEFRERFVDSNGIVATESYGRPFRGKEVESWLIQKLQQQREDINKKHIKIYKWLLGYGDFPICPDGKSYCWRSELRRKLPPDLITKIKESK